ncbi:hypothetical protein B9Z55_026178 [Caenorhabditis nigoni]|uniref:SUN domain-containing protein n=1 Tax=Caenorhabditis nigoni TaxID=1611254 RepID=A0A2G5T260_9PELO|nr:hypothetical protein B9Z55_026178 [Caenorhabditis nigoni]
MRLGILLLFCSLQTCLHSIDLPDIQRSLGSELWSTVLNLPNWYTPSVPKKEPIPPSSSTQSSSILNSIGSFWSSVFSSGSENQSIEQSSTPETNLLNSIGTWWKSIQPFQTKHLEISPNSEEEEESSVIPQLFMISKSTKENIPPSSKPTSTTLWKSLRTFVNSVIPSETSKEIIPPNPTPPSSNIFESIGKFWSTLTPKQQDRSSSSADEKSPIIGEGNMEQSESNSHTTQQPIPSSTSGNSSLSDHSKNTNSTEEEGSGSTLLDSDFIALLETKPTELLEATQTSIVENQEEHKTEEKHEASSTEPSETTTPVPTTTSTPLNDSIFDVSVRNVLNLKNAYDHTCNGPACDSDAICYVAPKDCTTNCEVIYAVSEKSNNATIYVKEGGVVHIKTSLAYKAGERRKVPNPRHTMISCFEASGNCWQGYEDGIIYEDRPSGYIGYGNYPLGQTNRRQEPKHQNWWFFARLYNKGPILEVGSHRILEYRRDPHSDANFGPFHALFLRSKE